jgi:prolyl-tRNA synthetase
VPQLGAFVAGLLDEIQRQMYEGALADRDARTLDVGSVAEAAEAAMTGFARLPWRLVGEEGEARLAEQALSVRCFQAGSEAISRPTVSTTSTSYVSYRGPTDAAG